MDVKRSLDNIKKEANYLIDYSRIYVEGLRKTTLKTHSSCLPAEIAKARRESARLLT
jgi:hypothetical protein